MTIPEPWSSDVEAVFRTFYTTERVGAIRLADGGGPFGFDITLALLIDDLLGAFDIDMIVETGCHLGDTTSYLARRYPDLPIVTCDTVADYVTLTRRRLRGHVNVEAMLLDSRELVAQVDARVDARAGRPLYFLDAHWDPQWPLLQELDAIQRGLVVIHDFDIGHPRFAYDTYDGVVCGPELLAAMASPPPMYFTPDPMAPWPVPCLQTGRRAGVGLVAIGLDPAPLERHPALTAHLLDTASN